MQIEKEFTATGIHFRVCPPLAGGDTGRTRSVERGEVSRASTALFPLSPSAATSTSPLLRVLEALWLEERLEETSRGYLLPVEILYQIEQSELEVLGLPERPAEVRIKLRTVGSARRPDFGVKAVSRHPEFGLLLEENRRGPFFLLGPNILYVSEKVAALYRLLDRGTTTDLTDQLLFIAQVKEAAAACNAELDPFLEMQDVLQPEGIGVEAIIQDDGTLEIRPVLEGIDEDAFPAFQTDSMTRAAYTRVEKDGRTRLVIPEDARATADEVRNRPRLTGPDVPRFFDNPEAYLPEGIDLERFSLRVRGLIPRRYNSQPYIRIQNRSRDWFSISTEIELAQFVADTATGAGLLDADTDFGSGDSPSTAPESGEGRSAELESPPPSISPETYAKLCREVVATGETWVKHEDAWIEIDLPTAERYLATWEAIEIDESGQQRISAAHERLVLDVISNLDELEYHESKAGRSALPAELPDYSPPATLQAQLMPHQLVGYRWLRYLLDNRTGGLLADDMGLGKTVQVIALLAHLAEAGCLRPSLLIVPKALMGNWHREIGNFCPAIKHIYHHQGPDRERNPERIAMADVVLTTYQTLRRDQLILGQVDWQVIACDEAQYIKNPTSQATSAVKGMKAALRLALTGTPVENGLSELWCIVDYVQPGKLGSQKEFRDTFERPMRDADETSTVRTELATELQWRLTPNYIRRTKEDVLDDLPPRLPDRTLRVPLGKRQQRLYAEVIAGVRSGDLIPIQALQHLIAIASHPELFERIGAPIDTLINECPKLASTLEVLEEIEARGEKVILFTRYKAMQQILQEMIRTRLGTHAAIINGEVHGDRRLALVDRLNNASGFQALILSPDAAGVGLNVTGANHVIHYTRLWNPAKENQATDRVHRIGQRRPVQVYYPLVTGEGFRSVEEKLDELLAEKQALARDVVWPRESLSVEREMLDFLTEGAAV